MRPKLIIHGGFFSESESTAEVKAAKKNALADAVKKAHSYLQNHSALQTVLYATALLEDCDLFNAGLGSQIQSDGKIRLSAAVMDGSTQRFAGVINVEDVKNPITIAGKLLPLDDRVLSGSGALDFARQNGFEYYNSETTQRRSEYEKKLNNSIRLGTVGAVALDASGKLAVATSTGGKGFELPCRVSDSATVAGNYANNHAAISCTGVGEDIVSGAVAVKIATRVADGFTLQDAATKTFNELQPFNGFAGAIGLSATGELIHIDSHPYMVWAAYDEQLMIFD